MKLYKSLFIATALLGGMMTSCSEDGVWDQASPANLWLTNGTSYAFDNTSIDYTYYPVDNMKDMDVNITVTRGTTQGTATINIESVFSDDELISGPTSVTFQDGSNTAVYPIHVKQDFDPGMAAKAKLVIDSASVGIPVVDKPKKLEPGATHEDSVKFLADSTAYAVYVSKLSSYKLATTVTIQKDYNWISLGMGTWMDYFYGASGEAEIKQAVENSKIFRVMLDLESIADKADLKADGNQSSYTTITLLDKGQDFRGVTIDGDNYVYWTPINTGYLNSSYGADYVLYHPMDFSVNWARYNNTSYVSKYQKDGTPAMIQLSGLYLIEGTSRGSAPCQTGDPLAVVVFPGVKIYNYNAKIEYAGLFTNPSNVTYALADYELTGADAKNAQAYKVAVISQNDDADAVADAILAGEYPASDLEDVLKDERIQIEIPEGLTGKLQIILVIIDKNEEGTALEVKNVVAAPFEYYAGGNPWKSLGQGYFVDDMILPLFGYAPDTYPVDIEESTDTPGLYRLVKMYSAVAADFGVESGTGDVLIHAENPNAVYIPLQPLELTLGKNGPFSLSTDAGELVEKYGFDAVYAQLPNIFGKLADGIITFPVLEGENSAGNPVNYQTWVYLGEKAYFGGRNGAFQIILPGVQAQSMKRAADFSRRLNGGKMKNAVMPSKISLKNKFFGLSIVK